MRVRLPALAAVMFAAAVVVGAGTAGRGDQSTTPDACAVLKRSAVAKQLGARVSSRPEKFPLPEPAKGEDLNSVLDVSETACTWLDLSKLATCASGDDSDGAPPSSCKLETVRVHVYERNEEYSGPDEWSDAKASLIPVMLGSGRRSYKLISNDKAAKTFHAPGLGGENVFIAVDLKTRGRRIAMLSYTARDGLVFMFSVLSERRLAALPTLVAVTRGVVT